MMKAILLCAGVLTTLVSTTALAQTNQPVKPVVSAVKGQPLTVDFKDGREAVVKYSVVESTRLLPLNLQVYDNLCSDRRGMSCSYQTPFRTVYYFLVWSKHSDSSKIGKPIRSKGADTGDESAYFEEQTLITDIMRSFAPKLTAGLPATKLVCNDFSWLPQGKLEAPASVQISQWNAETMIQNSETDANENQTLMSLLNMSLKRVDSKTLEITKVEAAASSFGSFFPLPLIGDVSTITIRDPQKGFCAVELKPESFDSVANEIEQLEAARTPRDQETKIYIVGSDESSVGLNVKDAPYMSGLSNLIGRFKYVTSESVE